MVKGKSVAAVTFICLFLLLAVAGSALAQEPPPLPAVYSGSVTMGGEPAPDGTQVLAKIEDYSSHSVMVSGGQYESLVVGPPSSSYVGKTIEFYVHGIKADQTDVFEPGTFHLAFALTIPSVPLMAAFTATPTSGEAPLTVQFTDHSIGEVTEWLWSFGDGETSNLQNPSYTYTSPGSYSVSLTVTGLAGSDTETKTNYITALSFSFSDLTISPAEVNIGETVTISVLVTNTGGVTGSCTVTLKINGVVEATKDVTVAAGGSEQVTFSTSKDAAGTYSVDIRGLTGSFKVKQAGTEFSLSNLTISPAEVNIGETVTISVLVANAGDVAGTCNVTLKIEGVEEATKDVTVAAGGSEQVSFSTSKDAAGTYSVDVNGLTGSFKVVEKATAPPGSSSPATPPGPSPASPAKEVNWPVIAIVGGAVIVVGVVIYLIARRRAY